jgi:hypothetical protein
LAFQRVLGHRRHSERREEATRVTAYDVAAIREHLRALYGYDNGGDAPGWLAVFELPSRHVTWFTGDDLFGAAPATIGAMTVSSNVYVGVCLQRAQLADGRGRADTVLTMPGVWFDLDIVGPHHKTDKLPRTTDEALDFVVGLPLRPTLVVHSGGGLQLYWLFDMLEVIQDERDRAHATQLSNDVQQFIIDRGREYGWRFDNTADLARILRPAGTMNRKSYPPTPVRMLDLSAGRYAPVDLRTIMKRGTPQSGSGATFPAHRGGDVEPRIRAYLAHADVGPWAPGNRDNCCIKMAVFMRAQLGLSPDETLAWLRALNAECAKPLPDAVLQDKARRAGRAA